MPQPNLFDPTLDWSGVRVQLHDHTPTLSATMTTTLQVQRMDGEWSTLHVVHWEGLMVDFIGTYVNDVTHAWLFGEPGDVIRAAKRVHKNAGHHATAHAYD